MRMVLCVEREKKSNQKIKTQLTLLFFSPPPAHPTSSPLFLTHHGCHQEARQPHPGGDRPRGPARRHGRLERRHLGKGMSAAPLTRRALFLWWRLGRGGKGGARRRIKITVPARAPKKRSPHRRAFPPPLAPCRPHRSRKRVLCLLLAGRRGGWKALEPGRGVRACLPEVFFRSIRKKTHATAPPSFPHQTHQMYDGKPYHELNKIQKRKINGLRLALSQKVGREKRAAAPGGQPKKHRQTDNPPSSPLSFFFAAEEAGGQRLSATADA